LWAQTFFAKALDLAALNAHIHNLEDQENLQQQVAKHGGVAFVADGSILPRASGDSDLPLTQNAKPFEAPENFAVTFILPHSGTVRGMLIPEGVTLVVGGGFHGKSTLLRAVEAGVYSHISGDGRERVATVASAVKIRAEDGRVVHNVNISGFMDHLPSVANTTAFSTPTASGSTSQAVNIMEALEAEAQLLLMDEDTCATNFMIRDARMQELVKGDQEPITPYLDRVRELYETRGVSSLIVLGGSGDYFEVADQVLRMHEFEPSLVTAEAKRIVGTHPTQRRCEERRPFPEVTARLLDVKRLNFQRGKKECVIQTRGLDALILGAKEVNTRYLEQFAEEGQLEACGWLLKHLQEDAGGNPAPALHGLKRLIAGLDAKGLEPLMPYNNGMLAQPRLQEAMAVLARIR
jgi:predicted ABC-class ATPase